MQGIFRKENTDKALKYGIYRHLPTYEKIIRNLVSFYIRSMIFLDKLDDFHYVVGVEKEYTDHFWKDKTEENKGETYGTEEDNSIDF